MRENIIKIAAVSFAAVMIAGATGAAAFNDVAQSSPYKQAIDRLAAYQIVSGTGGGNFNPTGKITRAQMAKISVIISGIDSSYETGGLFSDTADGYWANGYINSAAKNKLLFGYPDGSFKPEKNISYSEAVTVILRTLGYGTEKIGNNYPAAYIAKAKELKITDGLTFNPGDTADRQSVCKMIDNALMCDIDGASYKKSKLISNLDLSVSDECIILSTSEENSALLNSQTATSIGTYKFLCSDLPDYLTQTVKLVLNQDNEIVSVVPIQKQHKRIIATGFSDNGVSYSENNGISSVSFSSSSLVYYKSSKTEYSQIRSELNNGAVFDIYYNNGKYDYAVISSYDMAGPKIVYTDSDKKYYAAAERYVRDGENKTAADIQIYDVLYYDQNAKTVYAYSDKISGILEDVLPNKANPKQIVVSGKTYNLEAQQALTSIENCKINDYITCLKGKDGGAADILSFAAAGDINSGYGILLSCYQKITDGTKEYYAKFLSANGYEQDFKVSKNYDDRRGEAAKYSFSNGILTPAFLSVSNSVYGKIDKTTGKIGAYSLADNAQLIDLLYAPDGKEDANASAKTINLSDISCESISKNDVLYYQLDANKKISFIVFDNITMDGYKFGIVTGINEMTSAASYTIDIGGVAGTYSANFTAQAKKGQPVRALIENNKLLSLSNLEQASANGKIGSLDAQSVTVGLQTYSMNKSAAVYIYAKDAGYAVTDIADVDISQIKSVKLYSDKTIKDGGTVRIVILTIK